jgi:polyhydroxybutyrate depolymerase
MRLPFALLAALTAPALLAAACSSSGTNAQGGTTSATGSGGGSTSAGAGGLAAGSGGGVTASTTGSRTTAASTGAGGAGGASPDAGPIGGDRPVTVYVPPSYNASVPMPLVLLLHGYTLTGALEEAYMQIQPVAESRGFLYAHPDGTKDPLGFEFWNATNACCDLFGINVDDSAYLSSVISEIQAQYNVDAKRIFLVGHSNGAFMSYRMACDHADQIAAIASLAGAMWEDTTQCMPSQPVSVVEIHGTADAVILYDGGSNIQGNLTTVPYPSAPTTVGDWVTFDGCSNTPDTSSPNIDLDATFAGDQTSVTIFGTGCQPGGHAELWTMNGSGHVPELSPTFTPDVIDYLFAHPKP